MSILTMIEKLVGGFILTILKNMLVSWEGFFPNMMENEKMFQTTNQIIRMIEKDSKACILICQYPQDY